ncbi:hypothetical protein FRB99_006794 [Tulasnella sp. 403]|nr:hypothetical protein FRB99_006794 [Tulasnella sp. 403]
MSVRGRSPSPRAINGSDAPMAEDPPRNGQRSDGSRADRSRDRDREARPRRVIVVHNLTRNVLESHLRSIFGHYGKIKKVDFPTYKKTGQTRGKAALEYFDTDAAEKATSLFQSLVLVLVPLSHLAAVSHHRSALCATVGGSVLTLTRVLGHALVDLDLGRSPGPDHLADDLFLVVDLGRVAGLLPVVGVVTRIVVEAEVVIPLGTHPTATGDVVVVVTLVAMNPPAEVPLIEGPVLLAEARIALVVSHPAMNVGVAGLVADPTAVALGHVPALLGGVAHATDVLGLTPAPEARAVRVLALAVLTPFPIDPQGAEAVLGPEAPSENALAPTVEAGALVSGTVACLLGLAAVETVALGPAVMAAEFATTPAVVNVLGSLTCTIPKSSLETVFQLCKSAIVRSSKYCSGSLYCNPSGRNSRANMDFERLGYGGIGIVNN